MSVVLTVSNVKHFKELIKLTDNIWEVSNFSEIHAVAPTSRNASNVTIQNLLKSQALMCWSLNKLTLEIGSLKAQFKQHDSRRNLIRKYALKIAIRRKRLVDTTYLCMP